MLSGWGFLLPNASWAMKPYLGWKPWNSLVQHHDSFLTVVKKGTKKYKSKYTYYVCSNDLLILKHISNAFQTSQYFTAQNGVQETDYMINPHLYLKLCKGCSTFTFQLANLCQVVVTCAINVHMQVEKNDFRDIKILMDWWDFLKTEIKGSECHILNPNHLFCHPIWKYYQ